MSKLCEDLEKYTTKYAKILHRTRNRGILEKKVY